MGRCPFYKECKKVKNPGICESEQHLLLCKEYNRLRVGRIIYMRADQILKKYKKIRL